MRFPIDGGAPTALSASTTNATSALSYFPNDDRILFTADQGGNELNHIFVRTADGNVRDLTPGERLKANFHSWSADGRTFYVSTNERDPQNFDVYAYDAQTYDRRLIFQNSGYQIGDVSPDGRHVALERRISSANSDIYLARIGAAGEPRLVTPHQGNVAFDVFDFTPDGAALIDGSNEAGEFAQALRYDIATGQRRPMITADWDVSFVSHSPSGRYRVHGINEDASTRLTITDTRTNRPVRLAGLPAGDITLLVVQGANDPRVLQVESDELVAAVRRNNVPVEYVLFPDEGHGFRRRDNRITASEAYLNFLSQHLRR